MSKHTGLDNDPNSIFRASKSVVKIINKKMKKDEADRLKAEQATSDVGVTLSKPTEQIGTNISKDISSFSLQIKQLITLIDSYIDYFKDYFNLDENFDPLDMKKKKEKKGNDDSFYSPFETSSYTGIGDATRRVIGSQINNAPVQVDFGEGDVDEDVDFKDPGMMFNSTINKTFLVNQITKISNLTDQATSIWEDYISPNIRSLSKNKISSFLKIIKEFGDSIFQYEMLEYMEKIVRIFPELSRSASDTFTKLQSLFDRVTSEVGLVSGISRGKMSSPDIIRDLSVVKSDIVKITESMHTFEEIGNIGSLNNIVRKTNDAIIFWENNISPNVASLSKPDITKFLNSEFFITFDKYLTILIDIESKFRHGEQPEVGRVLQFAIDKLGEFIQLIGVDVEKINSISGGRMTGAGYLHVPTAYNRQLEYSDKKYLM
jgi:hypothetical protein